MAFDELSMKQMDDAAEQAKSELLQNFDKWTARDMTLWWAKWYMKAGHKRLGRVLVGIGKASGKDEGTVLK